MNEKMFAREVLVLFKMIGVSLIIALIASVIAYYTVEPGAMDGTNTFENYMKVMRQNAVEDAAPKFFWRSLALLVGVRYVWMLFNWARQTAE